MEHKYWTCSRALLLTFTLILLLIASLLTSQPTMTLAQTEVTPTPDAIPAVAGGGVIPSDQQTADLNLKLTNFSQQDIRRIESYDSSTNKLIIYHEHQINGNFSTSSSWYFTTGDIDLLDTPTFTYTGNASCSWSPASKRINCSGTLTSFTYAYRWQTQPQFSNDQFDLEAGFSWSGARANITTDFYYPTALTLINSTLPPDLNESSHLRWTVLDTTLFKTTLTFEVGAYTITGRVTDGSGSPLNGVSLTTGSGQTTITGSDGRYTITGLAQGEHTVTPAQNGFRFSPLFRTVSVGPADASHVDFTGSADPHLAVTPNKLRFFTTTSSNPADQIFTVQNSGSGILSWLAQEDIPWLTLNSNGGLVPSQVMATVDATGLSVGRYTGQIILSSDQAVNSPLTMEVALNVGCTPRLDVDTILVVDISGSMRGRPLQDAQEAANAFLDLLNLGNDQVGLVSFNATATLQAELTNDDADLRPVLNGLIAGGNTDIAEAMQVALVELQSSRADADHQPTIILLSDGRQTVSGDPIAAAFSAKAAGVKVITVGLGSADEQTLKAMASTASDYYYTPTSTELADIYEQISVTVGCPSLPDAVLAVNPSSLEFTTSLGGPLPAAQTLLIENSTGPTITWTANEAVPWLSLDMTSGQTPHSLTAAVDTNGLTAGFYTGQITFTSPEAVNNPVSVEVGLEIECNPRSPVDVALVVDVSSSMRGLPLDSAKAAATVFVEQMDLTVDQVALISFSNQAALRQPLSQDQDSILAKIEALVAAGNTNISEAVATARAELNSDRRRLGNQQVIVLLTDGRPNRGGNPTVQANAAKAEGIHIVTVGLVGQQGLDSNLLRSMATTPDDYYETPDAMALVQIYRNIAAQVGCPNLEITPSTLSFELHDGPTTGSLPLTIKNRQGDPIPWTLSEDIPWLSVSQTNGATPVTLTINVDAAGLNSGSYQGLLTIASPVALNSPQTVTVTLDYRAEVIVVPPPTFTVYLPLIAK